MSAKDLNSYATNDFRRKVDGIINREDVRGVLREVSELDAFREATKKTAFHPTLKAAVTDIINSDKADNSEAWKKINNASQYELINEEQDKDADNVAKFTVDKIIPREDIGLMEIEQKYVPEVIKKYYSQKYAKNVANDYEAGWSYTGDGRPINKSLTLDQYAEQRASEYADKYKGLVDKKLMQYPEYDHKKQMERMLKQQEYNEKLNKMKKETVEAMTSAQKDMIDSKSKRLQEQNKDLTKEDAEKVQTQVPKGKEESNLDHEKRLDEKLKEVEVPVTTDRLTKITSTINEDLKSAKKKEDGGYDKDYKVQVIGTDEPFWLKADDTLPADKYDIGNEWKGGRLDKRHIFEGIDKVVIRGGKKYGVGTLITMDEERIKKVPEYYKDSIDELTPDELSELEKQGYELESGATYKRIPVEVELKSTIPDTFSTKTTSKYTSPAGANNNPLNMRPKGDTKSFIRFDSLEEGFNAAVEDLTKKLASDTPALIANKKLRGREGKPTTIADIIETWSPRHKYGGEKENTDEVVDSYINQVSKTMGVSSDTPIADLDVRELALALAKHEDPKVYEELLAIIDQNEGNSNPKSPASKEPEPKVAETQPYYTKPVETKPKEDTSAGKAQKAAPKKKRKLSDFK